jgi:outer membrane murein-binding lipoprotein Lpp
MLMYCAGASTAEKLDEVHALVKTLDAKFAMLANEVGAARVAVGPKAGAAKGARVDVVLGAQVSHCSSAQHIHHFSIGLQQFSTAMLNMQSSQQLFTTMLNSKHVSHLSSS